LSKKLNDPTTKAQPLRFSPMRKFCMLTPVTCYNKNIEYVQITKLDHNSLNCAKMNFMLLK